ncbi:MAG: toll/interleukin-1 receptor domain-containing protein [Sphingomonas phyllosphaerae]|uniref:toll/interleukin-1 receptor domain-containing protein n=1 Tax=Sphingomonas phyllosphaerae TaxID=257003 RepID=UPI002FFA5439
MLNDAEGVERTVEIVNRLTVDRVLQSTSGGGRPKTIFVSVARQDASYASAIAGILKGRGLEVIFGDNEIGPDRMVPASIEQAIGRSDTFVIMWSRSYAQSPWCYDELDIALSREALGKTKVWLFNLDDSPIVPAQARKLPAVSVRNVHSLQSAIADLLS